MARATPNGFFPGGPWEGLRNPNQGLGNEDIVGTSTVAVNGDGRLEVFVENGRGGISMVCRQPSTTHVMRVHQKAAAGGWGPTPVGACGQGCAGQPATVTAPTGSEARIMLFTRNETTGEFTCGSTNSNDLWAAPSHAQLCKTRVYE